MFFVVINLIMIGGQILIIFVGGEAFEVKPLAGWEWGMSIGLGAISIPAGMVVRMLPDAWFSAIGHGLMLAVPKKWRPKTKAEREEQEAALADPEGQRMKMLKKPPHRTMSFVRGGSRPEISWVQIMDKRSQG